MRLIDADAMIRCFENSSMSEAVKDIAKTMPTVDAVRVVRCKDCRWYDNDWCNKLRISGVKAFEETWFCAEGERKGNAVD